MISEFSAGLFQVDARMIRETGKMLPTGAASPLHCASIYEMAPLQIGLTGIAIHHPDPWIIFSRIFPTYMNLFSYYALRRAAEAIFSPRVFAYYAIIANSLALQGLFKLIKSPLAALPNFLMYKIIPIMSIF